MKKYLPDYVDLETIEGKVSKSLINPYYEILTIPTKLFKQKADVYHALTPNVAIYLSLLKNTVTTIHDLADINDRQGMIENRYLKFFFNQAMKSQKLIAVSKLTKQKILENFPLSKDKIVVINEGVENRFKPLKKRKKGFIKIGYLGGFGKRRRIYNLFRLAEILEADYPKFKFKVYLYGKSKFKKEKRIFVNDDGTFSEKNYFVKNNEFLPYSKNIEIKGFVKESVMVKIYNSFDFFFFPSAYEGFSYPILEAQACGIPTFIMSDAKIPEETTKKCIKCDTLDEIAKKIVKLSKNKKAYNKISKECSRYVKKFDWKECIRKTVELYETIH